MTNDKDAKVFMEAIDAHNHRLRRAMSIHPPGPNSAFPIQKDYSQYWEIVRILDVPTDNWVACYKREGVRPSPSQREKPIAHAKLVAWVEARGTDWAADLTRGKVGIVGLDVYGGYMGICENRHAFLGYAQRDPLSLDDFASHGYAYGQEAAEHFLKWLRESNQSKASA